MGDASFPNSGIIYPDDGPKRSERSRDYRGELDVICPCCETRTSYWLSGWRKEGRKGRFLSLSLTKKEPRGQRQSSNGQQPASAPATDEDVPF